MPSTGPNAFAANIDVFRLTRSLLTANWLTQFGSVKWLNVSEDIEDALAVNDRWVPCGLPRLPRRVRSIFQVE